MKRLIFFLMLIPSLAWAQVDVFGNIEGDTIRSRISGNAVIIDDTLQAKLVRILNATIDSSVSAFGGHFRGLKVDANQTIGGTLSSGAITASATIKVNKTSAVEDFWWIQNTLGGVYGGVTSAGHPFISLKDGSGNYRGNWLLGNVSTGDITFAGAGTFGGQVLAGAVDEGFKLRAANPYVGFWNAAESQRLGYLQFLTNDSYVYLQNEMAGGGLKFITYPSLLALQLFPTTGNALFAADITQTLGKLTNTINSGYNLILNKGSGPAILLSKTNATAQDWSINPDDDFKIYDITSGAQLFKIAKSATGSLSYGPSFSVSYDGVITSRGAVFSGQYSNSPFTNSSWLRAPEDSPIFLVANSVATKYAGLKGDGNFIISHSGLLPEAQSWSSLSYTKQTTGWRAGPDGQADFRYLYVDEMHARAFIADLEQALAGSQIIAKSVTKIDSVDFTVPVAGASRTLVVEEFAGFTGRVFVNSDIVRIRLFTRPSDPTFGGSGLIIADAWGTVTFLYRNATNNPPTQAYTFTRSSGVDSGSFAQASNPIRKGTLVLDYGVSEDGFWEVDNTTGKPFARTATWTTHPSTGIKTRVKMGELGSGMYGILGRDASDANDVFRIDQDFAKIAGGYFTNTDIWAGNSALANAATKVVIGDFSDGGTPKIALGTSADAITVAGAQVGTILQGDGQFKAFQNSSNYIRLTPGALDMRALSFILRNGDEGGADVTMTINSTVPKIALGAEADAITIAGTQTGVMIDGTGQFKAYTDANNYIRKTASALDIKAQTFTLAATGITLNSANKTFQANDGNIQTNVGQTMIASSVSFSGSYGISIINTSLATEYLRLDNAVRRIAGWTFDDLSLYKQVTGGKYTGITVSGANRFFARATSSVGAGAVFVVDSSGALTATSATITSSGSGQRIEISSSTNEIGFFNSSVKTGRIYGTTTAFGESANAVVIAADPSAISSRLWLFADGNGIGFWSTSNTLYQFMTGSSSLMRMSFFGGVDGSTQGNSVIKINNAVTAPSANPSAGGYMWSEAGAGKWRGSSGTVTTFGPAEPHCPVCGSDYMKEFDSEKWGYFAICLKCLSDELGSRNWIVRGESRLPK